MEKLLWGTLGDESGAPRGVARGGVEGIDGGGESGGEGMVGDYRTRGGGRRRWRGIQRLRRI